MKFSDIAKCCLMLFAIVSIGFTDVSQCATCEGIFLNEVHFVPSGPFPYVELGRANIDVSTIVVRDIVGLPFHLDEDYRIIQIGERVILELIFHGGSFPDFTAEGQEFSVDYTFCPEIIYVDADANGVDDGSSWTDAYNYLQDALYKPPSGGDQIWVAEGTYYPDEDEGGNVTPGNRYATFQLINGVAIKGGYAGYGATDPDARDIGLYETILSGDIGTLDDNSDNCLHVFYHTEGTGLDATAVLDGFTITAGNANIGSWPDYTASGGGMLNYDSSPTVTNCIFTGNSAVLHNGGGGGMNNVNSSPTVTNCTFTGNSANWGGGMENDYDSSPTVTNCIFAGNSAVMSMLGGGNGGGMCNWQFSSPTVINCTFSGNSVDAKGGGMANWEYSKPTVINCTFSGNSVDAKGGGMANWIYSMPTVTNCTFTGNSATNSGGGMCNWDNSSPTMTNCTFAGNTAGANGGGMYNFEGEPNLTNCILWGNTASSGAQIYNDSSTPTVTYSNIAGSYSGTGNINADPCFVEPGHWDTNDTPNDTSDDFWVKGNYHLKSEAGRWNPNLYRSSDFTSDGIVNLIDFAVFANYWYFEGGDFAPDLNFDESVNMEDLLIFSKKFLTSGSTGGWTFDSVTSRCIDAGNPGSPLGEELLSVPYDPNNEWGQNLRINMGAYGGTAEASMPPYDWAILADLTNDGTVNFEDYAAQAIDWLESESEQPGDLNRDGTVDIADIALLTEDWLKQTSWYVP